MKETTFYRYSELQVKDSSLLYVLVDSNIDPNIAMSKSLRYSIPSTFGLDQNLVCLEPADLFHLCWRAPETSLGKIALPQVVKFTLV